MVTLQGNKPPTLCFSIKKQEDVFGLPMRQLFTRYQMNQKLTAIGHCTAFNQQFKYKYKVI